MSLRRSISTSFRDHCHIDGHVKEIAPRADKTAPYWNRLADIAGDGNAYQIAVVDGPVRRVVRGPAGAREVDLGPCMRCPGPDGGGIAVVGRTLTRMGLRQIVKILWGRKPASARPLV
jgi:hypothetical protein